VVNRSSRTPQGRHDRVSDASEMRPSLELTTYTRVCNESGPRDGAPLVWRMTAAAWLGQTRKGKLTHRCAPRASLTLVSVTAPPPIPHDGAGAPTSLRAIKRTNMTGHTARTSKEKMTGWCGQPVISAPRGRPTTTHMHLRCGPQPLLTLKYPRGDAPFSSGSALHGTGDQAFRRSAR
jgi:hypothetical protein